MLRPGSSPLEFLVHIVSYELEWRPQGKFYLLYHVWRRETDRRVVECHRAA